MRIKAGELFARLISVRQVAEVFNLIRYLSDHGIAVVLISHRNPLIVLVILASITGFLSK